MHCFRCDGTYENPVRREFSVSVLDRQRRIGAAPRITEAARAVVNKHDNTKLMMFSWRIYEGSACSAAQRGSASAHVGWSRYMLNRGSAAVKTLYPLYTRSIDRRAR